MTAVPRCVEALTAAMPAVRPRLFAAVTLDDTAAAAAATAAAEGRFMALAASRALWTRFSSCKEDGGLAPLPRPSFASLAEHRETSSRRPSAERMRQPGGERASSYLEDLRTQAGRLCSGRVLRLLDVLF